MPYTVVEREHSALDLVPRVMAVHVIQRDPAREVRVKDLQLVRLGDVVEEAWVRATRRPVVVRADAGNTPADMVPSRPQVELRQTGRGLRHQARRSRTEQMLDEIAAIYRDNVATGAPTKAVAEHYGVSPSTASLYVKQARDGGRDMGARHRLDARVGRCRREWDDKHREAN